MKVAHKQLSQAEAAKIEKELSAHARQVQKELGAKIGDTPAATQGKQGVPHHPSGQPDPVKHNETNFKNSRGLAALSSGRQGSPAHSPNHGSHTEAAPKKSSTGLFSPEQRYAALQQGHGRYNLKAGHWSLDGKHQVKSHAPRMQPGANAKPLAGARQAFHAPSAETNPNGAPRPVARAAVDGSGFARCEAKDLVTNGHCQ